MTPKLLDWINLAVGGLVIAVLLLTAGLWLMRPSEIPPVDVIPSKPKMPDSAFTLPEESYDLIGEPFLSLKFSPMKMQLPDLQRVIIYYGRNARPDAKEASPILHFALNATQVPVNVKSGDKLFLIYDRNQQPPTYQFSPGNKPTSLWIVGTPYNGGVNVAVGMSDQEGHLITEPANRANFKIAEKEFTRFGNTKWEIGKWRVDGTLLARQRARWYGKDQFLARHGGEEYADLAGKERIDFGEDNDRYSVYLKEGDSLVWKNDRWNVVTPGLETLGNPLMVVKKVDDRIMNLELWDVDGKGKMALNLLKSNETWMPQNIQKDFSYVGARTRTLFVFEVDEDRMLIRPEDWLILTDDGWRKITEPEEVDDYLQGKLKGVLFVFDGVVKKNDQQMLEATIFSPNRTAFLRVELPIQQGLAHFIQMNEDGTPTKPQIPIRPSQESAAKSMQKGLDHTDEEKED